MNKVTLRCETCNKEISESISHKFDKNCVSCHIKWLDTIKTRYTKLENKMKKDTKELKENYGDIKKIQVTFHSVEATWKPYTTRATIKKLGVGRFVYTNNKGKEVKLNFDDIDAWEDITDGIL